MGINDRAERSGSGGSHWALLAIRRGSSGTVSAEYYDSMGTANHGQATCLARKLLPMMGGTGKEKVSVCEAGKQDNQSDCGVFTLLFAEALARGTRPGDVSCADAAQMRRTMYDSIM